MRENNLMGADVDLNKLAAMTKNFSGAEIEGLVKSATSFALYGKIDVTKDAITHKADLKNIKVTMEHFVMALEEITPAFGVAEDELKNSLRGDILDWGDDYKKLMHTGRTFVRQVAVSDKTPLLTVLLAGPNGSGKSAIAGTRYTT